MIRGQYERGTAFMDCYQILRVPPNASRQEIDKAYRRLLKESRYDTSINLKDVESAYRVLGNVEQKKAYDSKLGWSLSHPEEKKTKKKRKKRIKLIEKLTMLSREQLLLAL